MAVDLRFDSRELAEVLRGPTGPVFRHLIERAERVKIGAKARVGVKTGKLRDSIVKRIEKGGPAGFDVHVGSELSYSEFHHEGTRPHVILPVHGRFLMFDVNGRTVFATRVNHPGTRPNRFLTDAARAEGFQVTNLKIGGNT